MAPAGDICAPLGTCSSFYTNNNLIRCHETRFMGKQDNYLSIIINVNGYTFLESSSAIFSFGYCLDMIGSTLKRKNLLFL